MPKQKHDDWPTFDSVFHELAPNSLSARERLAERAVKAETPSIESPEIIEVIDVGSPDFAELEPRSDADVQTALAPLPEAEDLKLEGETIPNSDIHDEYGLQDEILDLDNPNAEDFIGDTDVPFSACLLYTSPSPRDQRGSRMPSSA